MCVAWCWCRVGHWWPWQLATWKRSVSAGGPNNCGLWAGGLRRPMQVGPQGKERRRGHLHDSATLRVPSSGTSRPRREVPDLLSWVQCFGVYMAVVVRRYLVRVKKLLAYQTLIILEPRRCCGRGWLSCDSYFQRQMAGLLEGGVGDTKPLPVLSTILAPESPQQPNCTLCLEPDHQDEECTLTKAKPSCC